MTPPSRISVPRYCWKVPREERGWYLFAHVSSAELPEQPGPPLDVLVVLVRSYGEAPPTLAHGVGARRVRVAIGAGAAVVRMPVHLVRLRVQREHVMCSAAYTPSSHSTSASFFGLYMLLFPYDACLAYSPDLKRGVVSCASRVCAGRTGSEGCMQRQDMFVLGHGSSNIDRRECAAWRSRQPWSIWPDLTCCANPGERVLGDVRCCGAGHACSCAS